MIWEEPGGSIEFPCTPLNQINLSVLHSAYDEDQRQIGSVPLFSKQSKYLLNLGEILQL